MFKVGVLGREDERDGGILRVLGFLQRAFDHDLGAKGIAADLAREALLVAVAGRDVHDGGDTSAVFRAEAAGVDVGVADDVGIKDREQADGVERIVDHHTVQKYLVLDGRATTDVELTALVAREDDARHHLQVLGEVGLTAHARNLGDCLGCNSDDRSLGLGAGLNLVGSDGHRLQLLAGLLQVILAVNALVFRKVEDFRNGVVAHASN